MRFPELAKKLGKRVAGLVVKLEISVEEFARRCDIDMKTMYDILNGNHNTQDYNLLKICAAAGITMGELMEGLEELVDEKYDRRKRKRE